MGVFTDLTGRVYGRLTVLRRDGKRGSKYWWYCQCSCGTHVCVQGSELTRVSAPCRSCGCAQREAVTRHGMHGTRVYRIWRGMLNRCENKRMQGYKYYGARGITVCERWHNFENFLADMGEPPFKGASIDRKDNDGNYEPSNCRWSTLAEQNRNKRGVLYLAVGSVCRTGAGWAAELECSRTTVYERLARGWSVEDACTRPVRRATH